MLLGMSHLFSGGWGSELFGDLLWQDWWVGGRGSKINNPWNREGGEGHIFCKSYCVCVCGGGGGGGGECEEDQNSSISLHVSEMFKLLGAFTLEMPVTLSFLDSVLYEIQNKETNKQKKKKKKREREREKKKYTLGHFLSN